MDITFYHEFSNSVAANKGEIILFFSEYLSNNYMFCTEIIEMCHLSEPYTTYGIWTEPLLIIRALHRADINQLKRIRPDYMADLEILLFQK